MIAGEALGASDISFLPHRALGHREKRRHSTTKGNLAVPKLALLLQTTEPIEHVLAIYLTLS